MITSALPLMMILGTIAALALSGNLFSTSPFVVTAQVVAVGLNVWARRSFAKGTFRVTAAPGGDAILRSGPYGFIRHPMYSAALLFIWAGVLGHVSALTLAVGVAVTCLAVVRVRVEERLLRARYADYAGYARSTKALVPFLF